MESLLSNRVNLSIINTILNSSQGGSQLHIKRYIQSFGNQKLGMSIYLSKYCYSWLVELKILKPYIVSTEGHASSNSLVEVWYDDQIYLENGYLVGVLLKKILKENELYSQKLIKIRKIATLKKFQNWEIIFNVLDFLDYQMSADGQSFSYQQSSTSMNQLYRQIENILNFLYQQYGPQSQLRNKKPKISFHIEPEKLQLLYNKNEKDSQLDGVQKYSFQHCKNLLQYVVMVLNRTFDSLKVGECLGLLVDKGMALKRIIVDGIAQPYNPRGQSAATTKTNSNNDGQYGKISLLYQQVLNSISFLQSLLSQQPQHLSHFLGIFSVGVLCPCKPIMLMSRLLLQSIQCQQWLFSEGLKILLRSQHKEILDMVIQKSVTRFEAVFKLDRLAGCFSNEWEFLLFLNRMLGVVAKSRYLRQIVEQLTIQQLIQKAISPFNPESIETSEPYVRQLSRELITTLFKGYFKFMTEEQRSLSMVGFQVQSLSIIRLSFIEMISMLTQVFEIIKVLLLGENVKVEKWFRIVLRYMTTQSKQIKDYIMRNLKQLYFMMGRSFPLGAFLSAYQKIVFHHQNRHTMNKSHKKRCTNPNQHQETKKYSSSNINETNLTTIPQYVDYELLLKVSVDVSLVEDEVLMALNVCLEMFLQINGNCFIDVLRNLVKFKQSTLWSQRIASEILQKWMSIKLPQLGLANIYRRKSPLEKSKFEAFGIKRREILKFEEYQKYKMLLWLLCDVKEREFLRWYWRGVTKKMQEINRSSELRPYGIYLKKVQQKLALCKSLMPEPVEMVEKSMMFLSSNFGGSSVPRVMEDDGEEEQGDVRGERSVESPIMRFGRSLLIMGDDDDGVREEANQFLSPEEEKQLMQRLAKNGKSQQINIDKSQSLSLNLHTTTDLKPTQLQSNQPFDCQRQFTDQPIVQLNQSHNKNKNHQIHQIELISPEELQQHEITYLGILRENNQRLVGYCAELYERIKVQSEGEDMKMMGQFVKGLKIGSYITVSEVAQMHKKLIQSNPQTKVSDFTWQLIVQLAFAVFGFRRTTRTRVKLVETFVTLLSNNLSGQISAYEQNIKKQEKIMRRQMVYENELMMGKLLRWNGHWENKYLRSVKIDREQRVAEVMDRYHEMVQGNEIKDKVSKNDKETYKMQQVVRNQLQPWLVCFSIVNDILINMRSRSKPLNIGLVEPMSRVVSKVIDDKQGEQNHNEPDVNGVNEREEELAFLQKELERIQLNQQLNKMGDYDQLSRNKYKRRLKQNKGQNKGEEIKINTPKLQYQNTKQPNRDNLSASQAYGQFSKLSTVNLKQKIQSRKSQLEAELRNQSQKLRNQNYNQSDTHITIKESRAGKQTRDPQQEILKRMNEDVDEKTKREVEEIISYSVDVQ